MSGNSGIDQPLRISVVTATYNRPEMLRKALLSLQAQTYRNFDVLICDNANDPRAAAVVTDLRDDRFTYLGRPENLGLFNNAIDGFKRTTGDLVFKLDDDDSLSPDCFESLVRPFLEYDDVTLTFSDMAIVDEHDRVMPNYTQMYREKFGKDRLTAGRIQPFTGAAAHCAILLACAMVRRDAVEWDAVPPEADTSYDLFITLQAARDGAGAYYVGERLVNYRVHTGSDTAQQPVSQLLAAVFVLHRALGDPRQADRLAIRDALGAALLSLARQYLREARTQEARTALMRALRLAPRGELVPLIAAASAPRGLVAKLLDARHRRFRQRMSDAA